VNLLSHRAQIALGVLLALTSTVARTNAAPSAPLTIDVVLSMTARVNSRKDESLAFCDFEKTSNAKGGINGSRSLRIHDDATNPQVAVSTRSAISRERRRCSWLIVGSGCAAWRRSYRRARCSSASLPPSSPRMERTRSVRRFCRVPASRSFNYIATEAIRALRVSPRATPPGSGERSMDDATRFLRTATSKTCARNTSPWRYQRGGADRRYSRLRCAVSFAFTTGSALGTALHGFERCWNNLQYLLLRAQ